VSLKLYRPTPGGLEPRAPDQGDWRRRLRARRWKAASLENPEGRPTSPILGGLFFLGLAVLTFLLLVLGYGTGFWGS
jgi:hypothetical protein